MVKELYCHFSFRRKTKNIKYGIFACAFFVSEDSRKPIAKFVEAHKLWEDQQYVSAVQSFNYALNTIWQNQKELIEKGIERIYLVTDNSTLAKWIENPRKNKEYERWMVKAYKNFRAGEVKELKIEIGLADVVKYEKSYKFCKEEFISNSIPEEDTTSESTIFKIEVKGARGINDILQEIEPEIEGIEECQNETEIEMSDDMIEEISEGL